MVPRRDRRGECDLDKAVDAFLTGQEAVRCGDLQRTLAGEDYERARACVLAAHRARKPFTLVWGGANIDSVMRDAVAARVVDATWSFAAAAAPSRRRVAPRGRDPPRPSAAQRRSWPGGRNPV